MKNLPTLPASISFAAAALALMLSGAAGASTVFGKQASLAGETHPAGRRLTTITGSVAPGSGRVKVTVRGTGRSALVKAKTGLFVLRSPRLGGKHALIFSVGRKTFTTTVDAPIGGKLTLKDVKLKSVSSAATLAGATATAPHSSASGIAEADEEDVTVEGTLAVDCSATPLPTITVTNSFGSTSMSFDPSMTQIFNDATGMRITTCDDLSALAGSPVDAEGRVNPDGSLFAKEITVNPDNDSQGEDVEDVEFEGTIAAAPSCSGSTGTVIVTRSDGVSVTVNITDTTRIELEGGSDESGGSCAELSMGMHVKVEGKLLGDGSVNADKIEVEDNAFESKGTINSTNCSPSSGPQSISFTPQDGSTALAVTIGPATEIEVNDNNRATCGDLTSGPAEVEGVTQSDGSVAATEIEQGD